MLAWLVGSTLSLLGLRWWISVLIIYAFIAAGLAVYSRPVGQQFNRPFVIALSGPVVGLVAVLFMPSPYDHGVLGASFAWYFAWAYYFNRVAPRPSKPARIKLNLLDKAA